MKKLYALLLVLAVPCLIYGQTRKIVTEPLSYKQSIIDGEYYIPANGSMKCYYDDNNHLVRHGEASASGTSSLNTYAGSLSANHSAIVNYKDGALDGSSTITTYYSVSAGGQYVKMYYSCVARYKNNKPDGSWTVKWSAIGNGQKGNDICNVTFANQNITRFQRTSTAKGITQTTDVSFNNGVASGKMYDDDNEEYITLKSGVCTSKYIRLNGQTAGLDDKARAVVNDIVAKKGDVKPGDYIENGFMLEKKQFDYMKDFARYINDEQFGDYPYWSCTQNKISFTPSNCSYYMLKSVDVTVLSESQVLDMIEDMRKAKRNQMVLASVIDQIKESNKYYYQSDYYYIHKKDKPKILHYADSVLTVVIEENRIEEERLKEERRIAEEKRKEEERIAEEKRREAERIAEEKRREEERIAEERRREEQRRQDEYTKQLNDIAEADAFFRTNLFKVKANSFAGNSEMVPVKGKNKEAQTYLDIRNDLKVARILEIKDYKNLSIGYKEYADKIPDFLAQFRRLVFKSDYEDSLRINASKIVELSKSDCKDVGKNYMDYFKGFPFGKSFSTYKELKGYQRVVDGEFERQKECIQFIIARISINTKNEILKKSYSKFKDIAKVYENHFSTVDLTWNKDVTCEKLTPVVKMQNDLTDFIAVRDQIVDNDNLILISGKKSKNIVKLYSSYLSSQDLTWNPGTTKEKLNSVVEMQQRVLRGLRLPNIADLDKRVKKQKISTLEEVVKLF